MLEDALLKAAAGLTSPVEVLRFARESLPGEET